MRLPRTHGLAELRKVVSGSAMQSLWLRDRKVGSHVIGEDQSQLLGRGMVEKLGGEEEEPATKKRVHRYRVRFGQEKRASCLPSFSLGFDDDRRSTSGSRNLSLTICITSASCSKSLYVFH